MFHFHHLNWFWSCWNMLEPSPYRAPSHSHHLSGELCGQHLPFPSRSPKVISSGSTHQKMVHPRVFTSKICFVSLFRVTSLHILSSHRPTETVLSVARRHPKQELQDIFRRLIGCSPPGDQVFIDVHLPLAVLMPGWWLSLPP